MTLASTPWKINARPGRAIFGVNAVGNFEEDAVTGHGVGDTGAAEDRRIHGAERGNGHGQSNPKGGTVADDAFHHVGRNVLRVRDAVKGQHLQACRAEQQIHQRDERNASNERTRKIALRIFHFGADEIQIFPSIVGP